jgi:hypothetical protein
LFLNDNTCHDNASLLSFAVTHRPRMSAHLLASSDPLLPSLLGLFHLLDRLDRITPLSSVLLLPFFEHDHDLAVDPAPSVLFDVLQTGKPVQVAPVGEDQVYHALK